MVVWNLLISSVNLHTVTKPSNTAQAFKANLGWEDSLEKEMEIHSSTLALKIPWMEEPSAGYYPWGRK